MYLYNCSIRMTALLEYLAILHVVGFFFFLRFFYRDDNISLAFQLCHHSQYTICSQFNSWVAEAMGVKFLVQGNNSSRKPQLGIKPGTLWLPGKCHTMSHWFWIGFHYNRHLCWVIQPGTNSQTSHLSGLSATGAGSQLFSLLDFLLHLHGV